MDKQEILKKAQNRDPNQFDEMEKDVLQKSGALGMGVGLLICMVLTFIKTAIKQPWQIYIRYIVLCFALTIFING